MVDPGTGAWYHSTTVGRPVKPSKLRIHALGFMDSKDLELSHLALRTKPLSHLALGTKP